MPVLAVAHSKGGAGKTTTAFNLICELKPALTIDLDIQRSLSVINSLRDADKQLPIVVCTDRTTLLNTIRKHDEAGELVVVDCGGFDSDLTRAAIAVADLVITPANDAITERIGLSLFDKTLSEVSHDLGQHIQAHLLICKVHPSKKHFPALDSLLEQTQHISRLNSIIAYRTGKGGHTDGLEYGEGVTESLATRHGAAGKEIVALADEIRSMLAA